MLQNSTTCTFRFNKLYLYSTRYIYIQHFYSYSTIRIFFQLQPKLFSFNKNICSTSTKNNFIQQQYLFLQPTLFSFNKNNYSTSTKTNFIQQQSSRTFQTSSFNKIPRPSPVKYKTTLSHASNISKTCQIHNWQQITLLSRGLKFIPAPVTRKNTIRHQLLNDFSQFDRKMRRKYTFHGNDDKPHRSFPRRVRLGPTIPALSCSRNRSRRSQIWTGRKTTCHRESDMLSKNFRVTRTLY